MIFFGSVHGRFRFEKIFEETSDKFIEELGRETIRVDYFSNYFKLTMKVLVGGAKMESSVNEARNYGAFVC